MISLSWVKTIEKNMPQSKGVVPFWNLPFRVTGFGGLLHSCLYSMFINISRFTSNPLSFWMAFAFDGKATSTSRGWTVPGVLSSTKSRPLWRTPSSRTPSRPTTGGWRSSRSTRRPGRGSWRPSWDTTRRRRLQRRLTLMQLRRLRLRRPPRLLPQPVSGLRLPRQQQQPLPV